MELASSQLLRHQVVSMFSRVYEMSGNRDGFNAFIDASKRASQKGDLRQAERLLKTSLRNVEQQMIVVEYAMREIVESLIDLYRNQDGKQEEIRDLERKLAQLRIYDLSSDGVDGDHQVKSKESGQ